MLDIIKPIYRAFKYNWLYRQAKYQAQRSASTGVSSAPTSFIIGCGRSGTTILGKLLAQHPQVKYYFEPYHLWAVLDHRTDVLSLYQRGDDAQLMLQAEEVAQQQKATFPQLFHAAEGQHLIEKTPLNAFRIGYLRCLVPQAKFIHIVRDGIDVSQSIGRIATSSPYKIAGKPLLNQWWGVAECKWNTLIQEGEEAGYWPDEIPHLKTQQQRGAYEWLASLKAIDHWKETLGDNFLEISYSDLVSEPDATLTRICKFLALDLSQEWLAESSSKIKPQESKIANLQLPQAMAHTFNNYQKKYKFTQQATPMMVEVR